MDITYISLGKSLGGACLRAEEEGHLLAAVKRIALLLLLYGEELRRGSLLCKGRGEGCESPTEQGPHRGGRRHPHRA